MATLVYKCPHCQADRITFDIPSQSHIRIPGANVLRKFVFLRCRECGMPSAAEISSTTIASITFEDLNKRTEGLTQIGYSVVEMWPKPAAPKIPAHLPDPVARAFLAAERNFALKDMEEASAGSYGRALDIGTKILAPEIDGMLFARLKELAKLNRITPELAAWAHEIRLIRNYAMHALDDTTREELIAIRGFTEMVLTYLFTLPGMLKARKADAGVKDDGATPSAG